MQLFINNFQKGSKETSQIGMGNLVGFDIYSKKGVARLAKKSTRISTPFTAEPHFIESSASGTYTWVQCGDGSVYYSADSGATWQVTNTAFPDPGSGNGLIFFQNFMFAFTDTKIYYWKDAATISGANPTNGAWVDWTSAVGGATGTLQSTTLNPINGLHFPFLYPNNRGVYFGNGGNGTTNNAVASSCTIGFFGQVSNTLFNPAGTRGTDFLWDNGIFSLPSLTYSITSINFLPPSKLAISVVNYQNPAQGAELITWDTISNSKFDPPLKIFSNSLSNTTTTAGIKQLWNRNQVLYAVTGGNHSIYETNGSSFNLLEDISLYSNVRQSGGAETDLPVFYNSYPQGIGVVGNKLLTATAPSTNTAIYPSSGNGIFPIGIWSIAFNPDGSHSTQCEFTLPIATPTSPSGNGNYFKITCLKPISQISNSTTQLLVGFSFKGLGLPSETFGVCTVDLYNYIDDLTYTALESEMFEIGTYLNPKQVGNIEVNLVKKLKTGQTFDLAYRTGLENDWTNIPYEGTATVTGDNTKNSYSYTSNAIGAVQFIQFRFRMATNSGNATNSPELRSISINPLSNN